jgi:hypothetical protein
VRALHLPAGEVLLKKEIEADESEDDSHSLVFASACCTAYASTMC